MMASFAPTEDGEAARRRAILVVEDDILIRMATSDHLREDGFQVIEAANAAEAISVLASRTKVDAIFSDINMAGSAIDGLRLVAWVHENRPDIPILLASGAQLPDDAKSMSADLELVIKPYSLDRIAQRLDELIHKEP